MTKRTKDPLPTAQREHLVVTTLDDETIIYDKRTRQATCLNAFAAQVWSLCDGRRTSADITNAMSVNDGEAEVLAALRKLTQADLLSNGKGQVSGERRGFLTGATAGLAVVSTLAIPSAANAVSFADPASGLCGTFSAWCPQSDVGTQSTCCNGFICKQDPRQAAGYCSTA